MDWNKIATIALVVSTWRFGERDLKNKRTNSSSDETQYTCVEYMYRDAGNWKFRDRFWLKGIVAQADVEPFVTPDLQFIPRDIGVKDLVPEIKNDDDHFLHEFVEFAPCQAPEPNGTVLNRNHFLEDLVHGRSAGWLQGLFYFLYDNPHEIIATAERSEISPRNSEPQV